MALDAFGRWIPHQRWGEVWIPARRTANWEPYRTGRWVYTEEWGWYWVAADDEADWGWVTYHYGRWAFDRELGWVWIPECLSEKNLNPSESLVILREVG